MQRPDVLPSQDARREIAGPVAVASRLILRPGAIGDLIVSLPALEALRAPRTEIWCSDVTVPLVHHLGCGRSLVASGIGLLGLEDVEPPSALLERLRSFDEIVSWYGTARTEFQTALSAIHPAVRFFPALPPAGCDCHAVDYYARQVSAPDGLTPRVPVSRRQSGGFVAIHPFSGSPKKNWPLTAFRTVAEILKQNGLEVFWLAGPEEELAGAVRLPGLDEVEAWLGGAVLFIGNDSGIGHLAAACGVPVVSIFGPSDPAVWAPRGPRVQVMGFENSAQELAEAALGMLRQ